MTFLQLLPLLFVLAGLILYTVLAGADLGTGVWQLTAAATTACAAGCTPRSGRCGRPTTSG